jgi:uncharacterized protein YijF (DUF1287 family)/L,D-peptidoglycan transpeptidase YkuD (ErfK/YbiS/YcfS/YnhG family)
VRLYAAGLVVSLWLGLGACKANREIRSEPPRPAAAPRPATPRPAPREKQPTRAAWPTRSYAPSIEDKGIFSELAGRVRLHYPRWLSAGPALVVNPGPDAAPLLFVAGSPVGFAKPEIGPVIQAGPLEDDTDRDGIPDALDLLIGAKKAALNRAVYKEGYRRLPYPGGDVPRTEGVCTDVVIRALRNAGFDLQQLVHRDILSARRAYPMVRRPDTNIDHRRVRTLLVYFKRHWSKLPTDPKIVPLLPGDLVFLNTMKDPRPDHLGIISDRLGRSGRPLVINNWTVGYRTAEMDLLQHVPVTHRFRIPSHPPAVNRRNRGLAGLLERRGLVLPDRHRQVLLVTLPTWTSAGGTLRRYARGSSDPWRSVGKPVSVRVGAKGLGRGRGLHDSCPGALSRAHWGPPAVKREGDHRSPAGVFALGTALGRGGRPPYHPGSWPWRPVDDRDRLVDDPGSPHYNTWQRIAEGNRGTWRSAEDLSRYRLALLVRHNLDPIKPGAGSAIFLHTHWGVAQPTVGCTTMSKTELIQILRWLDPASEPVLVQVAGVVL